MACALTQGYALDCKDGIGGISEIFFIEHANVTSITETTGVVSVITKATGKRFWKYVLEKEVGNAKSNLQANVQNGTSYYQPEISFSLNKMQASVRNEILLLVQNRLIVVVKDRNGKWWMFGRQNGLDVTGGGSDTGTAMGDRNGYTLTISGMEPSLEYEVNSTAAGLLETPGT